MSAIENPPPKYGRLCQMSTGVSDASSASAVALALGRVTVMNHLSRIDWLRRMAVRLRQLINDPTHPISLVETLDVMASIVGSASWRELSAFTLDDSHLSVKLGSFEHLAVEIYQRFRIQLDPESLITALLTPGDPVQGKIRKKGPFIITRLAPEYPWYGHVLANAIKQIRELPDFSEDTKVMVMSDFSGEHDSALFNTYSFAFFSQDKSGLFERGVRELRQKHLYNEISYKRLDSGPARRALPVFLDLVDRFVHGAVITIAIDKDIPTLFGTNKHEAHTFMLKQLEELGLGKWKGPIAEKAARVCHTLAIFSSLLLSDRQLLLWYSDNDPINADGKHREFAHLQELFKATWSMYGTQTLDLLGFAKSFETKSYLDDMLSVADLAAGALQDLLQQEETSKVIPGGDDKLRVMKWISSPSRCLSKINVLITMQADGTVGSGLVTLSQTEALKNYDWSGGGIANVTM